MLAPSLSCGDIVVMDNLRSHKVKGVWVAIEALGASVLYLPPYSPDLNPIEPAFSKIKQLLRSDDHRAAKALWGDVQRILDAITPRAITSTVDIRYTNGENALAGDFSRILGLWIVFDVAVKGA